MDNTWTISYGARKPDRCEHCEFYSKATPSVGTCHRYAPKPDIHQSIGERAPLPFYWPVVRADAMGCGDGEMEVRA